MSDPAATSPGTETKQETARRMRAIAAELTAAGLHGQVNQTHGVLDITATLSRPARKDTHVIVDEDGYVEVRYWNDPDATPAHIVAIITRALTVITRPT